MLHFVRRPFSFLLLMLSLALALTGCGSQTVQQPQDPQPLSNLTPSQPAERVVKTAFGEVKLPAEPKRIVVLENGALENLLALGVTPVGAATVSLDQPFFPHLADKTTSIQKVGTIDQPNLESIAALNPDVIIGSKDEHEAIYSKLTQIAPTVFTESMGLDWKGNLKLHGEVVGKTVEADKLISDYDKRVTDFKAKMGDQIGKTEVSILRVYADHVRMYLPESFSGKFIEELGFARPKAQSEKKFGKEVTEEQIAEMDGDVIFWFSRDKMNFLTTKLQKNPLWSSLKGVKQAKIYEVSTDTWLSGMGILSRNLMLDEVIKHLAKTT